ncbi:MAG: glycosyltransferase family protein [bacterium]
MKTRSDAARILIYSQDGFGLGHLRRNLNISLQIKKRSPSASILIVADSPVAPFFKLPPRCDFIKLPTIVKVDTGVWRPNRLPMNYRDLLYIRSEIIQNVALSFKPHVFLVDHMPHGALGELDWPLRVLKRYSPETKVILGLRDILGAPEDITKMWQNEGAFDAAEKFYDHICVYGCTDVFDLINEYQFPKNLVAKTRYCGYVSRDHSIERKRSNPALKRILKDDKEKMVLVTGGGGADASYFMDKFLDAVKALKNDKKFQAVISTGPFMQKDQVRLLQKKAQGLPIWVKRNSQDSIDYIRRADLVISMAGYNTVSEIMRFKKNAIIVPRSGPSAEQTMRTNILSERGVFNAIHPSKLTTDNFAELIATKLNNGTQIVDQMLPDLEGAPNVSSFLLSAM